MIKKTVIILFLILAAQYAGRPQGAAPTELAFAQMQDDGQPCPPECVTDSMEIVTWYPSPWNAYDELRSNRIVVGGGDEELNPPPPHKGVITFLPLNYDPVTDSAGTVSKGSLYYYESFDGNEGKKFRYYDGSIWKDLGGGGWEISGNDLYNINSGNVGIGTNNPVEKLDISGGLRINNTSTLNAGTIRWTGSDFEGYDGTVWLSLTGKKSYLETKCTGQGGSFESPQGLCYFPGSSCLTGWKRYKSYGSASACSCWNSCGNSSSAPAFYRVDAALSGCSVDTPYWYCWPANKSCSQGWSEVGCMPE